MLLRSFRKLAVILINAAKKNYVFEEFKFFCFDITSKYVYLFQNETYKSYSYLNINAFFKHLE